MTFSIDKSRNEDGYGTIRRMGNRTFRIVTTVLAATLLVGTYQSTVLASDYTKRNCNVVESGFSTNALSEGDTSSDDLSTPTLYNISIGAVIRNTQSLPGPIGYEEIS